MKWNAVVVSTPPTLSATVMRKITLPCTFQRSSYRRLFLLMRRVARLRRLGRHQLLSVLRKTRARNRVRRVCCKRKKRNASSYITVLATAHTRLHLLSQWLPDMGQRQPMRNPLTELAKHPPKTRRACVIRWTEVFHRHLLLLLDASAQGVHNHINLHRLIQCIEVTLHYSSSIISVNQRSNKL